VSRFPLLFVLAFSCTPMPASAIATDAAPTPADTGVEWCVDPDHCSSGLMNCLKACYERNHPHGPQHGACDDNCRSTYCERIVCPPR